MKRVEAAPMPGRRRDPAIDIAILKASLKLFLQLGVEGVNYEQISSATGISRATIYRRWKSRPELLKATLESARTSVVRDPSELMRMPSSELPKFIEDTIVLGLVNPVVPRLVTQLIGAFNLQPDLLTTWCSRTLAPGWQALSAAIGRARIEGAIPNAPDSEILRDLLAGAIVCRLISRTQQPKEHAERKWAKSIMGQLGLAKRTN